MKKRRGRRSVALVFAVPLLLAVATLVGLVAGLTGDGARDALAWLLLGLPVAVLAFAWAARD